MSRLSCFLSFPWFNHCKTFFFLRPKYGALANNFADPEAAGKALEAIGCEKLDPVFDISGDDMAKQGQPASDDTSSQNSHRRPSLPAKGRVCIPAGKEFAFLE